MVVDIVSKARQYAKAGDLVSLRRLRARLDSGDLANESENWLAVTAILLTALNKKNGGCAVHGCRFNFTNN